MFYRSLIFGTQASVEVLTQADSAFSDGTFRYVNRLFSQLYTIHGKVIVNTELTV